MPRSRCDLGCILLKIAAISLPTGAETWAATWESDGSLPDPRCQAALLGDPGAGLLYFGHPSSPHSRSNYSVHISRDGGLRWELHRQIYSGGSCVCLPVLSLSGATVAIMRALRRSEYSDMTFTGAQHYDEHGHAAQQLACVFEKDDYKEIALAIVPKAAPATADANTHVDSPCSLPTLGRHDSSGPLCDGVADDTAALQQAIERCRGRKLTLRSGSNCTSRPLTLPSGSWLHLEAGATLQAVPREHWGPVREDGTPPL